MVEIRTPLEIKRAEHAKKICDWWKKNCDLGRPGATRNRYLNAAASHFGMTAMGIKNILVRNGIYD